MDEWIFIWTDDPDEGNIPHLAEHGVSPEEFKQVVRNPIRGPEPSRSEPEHMVAWGYTKAGRY